MVADENKCFMSGISDITNNCMNVGWKESTLLCICMRSAFAHHIGLCTAESDQSMSFARETGQYRLCLVSLASGVYTVCSNMWALCRLT